jgi:hypothetical protein
MYFNDSFLPPLSFYRRPIKMRKNVKTMMTFGKSKKKYLKNICREDDWKSMARTRLRKFEEELQSAIETGMQTYSGHTTWNFVNGVLYCFDIATTIGEGFFCL